MWDGGDETAPFVSRLCEESLQDLESTTYISSGNMFFLKLTTDSTGKNKGFSADYFSIPAFATTTQWRTNTAAVTTSDVVATSSLPSTQQVILTSVPKTDKTNDSRTDKEASSLPPFETVSLASVTFHLPPPGDLNLVIVLVPIGLLILLGLLCLLIYCMNEAKNRKLYKTSEEVGPNVGDVSLHVHHNDGYEPSDGYTALQISKKLSLTADATAVSIDKVTMNNKLVSSCQIGKLETEPKPEILENYWKTEGEIIQSIEDSGSEGFVTNDLYERYSDADEDRNGEAKRDSEGNRKNQHDYEKTSEDESMSRNEFKLPDTIDKMGDDGGNIFNVAYESYDDYGGRRGKEEPGDGVFGNDFRSNAVYENSK
ncbi:uncharacterized protein [Apostichopus japonicus]